MAAVSVPRTANVRSSRRLGLLRPRRSACCRSCRRSHHLVDIVAIAASVPPNGRGRDRARPLCSRRVSRAKCAFPFGCAALLAATPGRALRRRFSGCWRPLLLAAARICLPTSLEPRPERIDDILLATRDRRPRVESLPGAPTRRSAQRAERATGQSRHLNVAEALSRASPRQRMILLSTYSAGTAASPVSPQSAADDAGRIQSYLTRSPISQLRQASHHRQALEAGYMFFPLVLASRRASPVRSPGPFQSRFYEPSRTPASSVRLPRPNGRRCGLGPRRWSSRCSPGLRQHRVSTSTATRPDAPNRQRVGQPAGGTIIPIGCASKHTTSLSPDGSPPSAWESRDRSDMGSRPGRLRQPRGPHPVAPHHPKLCDDPAQLCRRGACARPPMAGCRDIRDPARLPYGGRETGRDRRGATTLIHPGSLASASRNLLRQHLELDQGPLGAARADPARGGSRPSSQIALHLEVYFLRPPAPFTFSTAFTEGWRSYAEACEENVFTTRPRRDGPALHQAWRRLGWFTPESIRRAGTNQGGGVLRDNTALPTPISRRGHRIIIHPGTVPVYKIGELKIRELRAKAQKDLGAKFDLRRFHDAVLLQGSVPLDVLEAQVGEWIEAEKGRPSG